MLLAISCSKNNSSDQKNTINTLEGMVWVEVTNYITISERKIDWEVMKSQVPEGNPKPHDSILQPGSLIFNKNINSVANMSNYSQWWSWKTGVNWKHT